MAEDPETPDLATLLAGTVNQGQLKRLERVAEALLYGMLDRRQVARPTGAHQEVRYRQGTRAFGELHEFADEPQMLVALLDWVAQRLTANEPERWRVALADPATCPTIGDGLNQIMLYPDGTDVANMTEVHPEVRIFRLHRRPGYEVMELAPFLPERIANERQQQADPLLQVARRWNRERDARHRRLVRRLRGELERQQATLDPEVMEATTHLIEQAATQFDLVAALQAASYLGIYRQVTIGFDMPPST